MIKDTIKIFFIVIISLLLIASLSLMLASRTYSRFLEPGLIKPAFQETTSKLILNQMQKNPDANSDDFYQQALTICQVKTSIEVPMTELGLENITIQCPEIKQAGTIEKTFELIAGKAFEQAYYKKYDCIFLSCLGNKQPLALTSQESKNFSSKMFFVFLAVSIILLAFEFLFYQEKKNFFVKNSVMLLIVFAPALILSLLIKNNGFMALPKNFVSDVFGYLGFLLFVLIGFSLAFLAFGLVLHYRKQDL